MNTTIKREDLDRGAVDFSDVVSGRRLPLVHPGEILRDEFLTPMKCSVYRLAQAIKVSRPRLNDLVLGRRRVTTDTALRLGRYFGTTPEFWINLQTRYDLDVAERTVRAKIEHRRSSRASCERPRPLPVAHLPDVRITTLPERGGRRSGTPATGRDRGPGRSV